MAQNCRLLRWRGVLLGNLVSCFYATASQGFESLLARIKALAQGQRQHELTPSIPPEQQVIQHAFIIISRISFIAPLL